MHLLYEDLLDLLPELVIADDIILHMDVSPRLPHFLHQGTEFRLSVCIDPDIIIVCQDRLAGFQIIEDQVFKPLHLRIRQFELFAIDRLLLPPYRVLQLAFDLFCLKHPALVKILPDDQVQDKSQDRYKIQQKQPRPDGLGGPSLEKDDDQREEDVNDNDIVHDKIIDCHRSVPNHFCHVKNSFFKSLPPAGTRRPGKDAALCPVFSRRRTATLTVYPLPWRKANPKYIESALQIA